MVRILLAEDDKNFGMVMKQELEDDGHIVHLVNDGVQAVLRFIPGIYDLILLDIRMPRLTGTDALRIIKSINPHVPAITFSGNAGSHEISETLEYGALKCLSKPFAIGELKQDIRNYFMVSPDTDPGKYKGGERRGEDKG